MPHEQPVTHDTPPQDAAVQTQDTLAHEPVEGREEWLEEPEEPELPRRPRRRLLGVGGNRAGGHPIPIALLAVLLIACGFIGGVLVEKGQSSSSGTGASGGLAARFAALRGGAGAAGGASAGTSAGGAGFSRGATGGSGAGAFAGGAGAGGGAGATIGQVAYVSGHTLYVTNSEGNTVKVTTSAASTVTKTVKADVKGIHPGETVIVTGSAGANGAISAESVRVSEAGAGGGLGALFGSPSGSSRGGGNSGGGGSGGSSGAGSGEPALFGK
jgi:hypothetical protein